MRERLRPAHLVVVVVLSLVIQSACAPTHRAPFVITAPTNDASFPSNPNITVRVSVIDLTHLNLGDGNTYTWDHLEYSVSDNGELVAAHEAPLSIRSINVGLTAPVADGVHWVDVRGRAARAIALSLEDEPGWAFSPWYHEVVCFWVGPNKPADVCSVRTIVQPVQPATPTASPIPPTPTPDPIVLVAEAHPNPLYYGEACPALSTVTLRAALAVPAGMTAELLGVEAHLSVLQGTNSNTVGELVVPLEPSLTWDTSTGGQIFSGTVDVGRPYEAADSSFDPAVLGGDSGAILWYVEVLSGGGDLQKTMLLERSANQVIDLAPCPTQDQPRQERPGDGSSPGGSETGCGQYTNQLSCNLAGCSWIAQNSACIISP